VDRAPPLREQPKSDGPLILFVGRLARNKRPDHAVEAFRVVKNHIRSARLVVVGRGPMEKSLRRSLPDGAEMHGHVERAHLFALLAEAHCLLVPSVREGWGLVVIEANSVGTPAIGYDVPGLRDSIRHERTGLLVPPDDPQAMGIAALNVLSEPNRLRDLGAAALEWASSFSWQRAANDWARTLTGFGLRIDGMVLPEESLGIATGSTHVRGDASVSPEVRPT
jgi:glycosyltransferase involved in cell wall biosynthesis